jgi:hypothetical protein
MRVLFFSAAMSAPIRRGARIARADSGNGCTAKQHRWPVEASTRATAHTSLQRVKSEYATQSFRGALEVSISTRDGFIFHAMREAPFSAMLAHAAFYRCSVTSCAMLMQHHSTACSVYACARRRVLPGKTRYRCCGSAGNRDTDGAYMQPRYRARSLRK